METKFIRSTPYEDYSFELLIKATDLSNANPREFNIDFFGDAQIEINTIQFVSTGTAYQRIEIQSPELQFDYGNLRYINITYPLANSNLASGYLKYKFHSYLNGKININVIDTATKAVPIDFNELIISGC
ncbi:MAG: hypothetical protein EBR82_70360, partial [Caulobacteraceae bacterium]|nr:hypothetical protein [Caulobacteraceae bacterium]